MGIISALISLPVSIILILWLRRCKKENPFVKGNIRRLIIAGMLSAVLGSILTGVYVFIRALDMIGLETLKSWITDPNAQVMQEYLDNMQAANNFSFAKLFLAQFISVGCAEELSRYLFFRLSTDRQEFAKTQLDYVICGGILGTGFTIVEDLLYSSGGLLVTAFRAFMPFHFTFGAIMGYYMGKARVTGRKGYHVTGILLAVLLHTFFDASLNAIEQEGIYIFLAFAAILLSLIITIVLIVKINKWSKAVPEHMEDEAGA